LNGSAVALYVRTVSPEFRGGHVYSARILDDLLIVPLDDKSRPIYEAIERAVEEIIAMWHAPEAEAASTCANAERQKQLEAEIDALVERLYGLPGHASEPRALQ
jgi:hypothetical protein